MATQPLTPRFIIAKYVPDLARMEPRNIGILLWSRGRVCARFLDPLRAAEFVNEVPVYQRWVSFWSSRIEGDSIAPRRGQAVSTGTPECLDALLTTQQGNYILVDGGELMLPVRKKELDDATEFLFKEIVATKSVAPTLNEGRSLSRKCLDLLDQSGITELHGFRQKYPVKCDVYGVSRNLHVSYGCGNGHPDFLLQRAQLTSEQSVSSAALTLHSIIIGSSLIPRKNCRALIQKSDVATEAAEEGLRQLQHLCETVAVDDSDAKEQLRDLVNGGRLLSP